nr:DUF2459 domain-containing protein [Winogradskyella forsetii]
MKVAKKILKYFFYVLLIPITYLVASFILTYITIDRKDSHLVFDKSIYLTTNGVHLDIIIPKKNMDSLLVSGIKHIESANYLAFGWGDENFYLNTPTWGDLTFSNGFRAAFLNSTTLMHVTRYEQKRLDWLEIKINAFELEKMNSYLRHTFQTNKDGEKIILKNKGYTSKDDFYKAKGSYSCFKTCNSWVNTGFKKSGLKSCLWTPFDFGLINKYE